MNRETCCTRAVQEKNANILKETGHSPYWIMKNLDAHQVGCCAPAESSTFTIGCVGLSCQYCPFDLTPSIKTREMLITFLKTYK